MSANLPVLGIDPGHAAGGIVYLAGDGRSVYFAIAYKRMEARKCRGYRHSYRMTAHAEFGQRGYHASPATSGEPFEVRSLGAVALVAAGMLSGAVQTAGPAYLVACESVFRQPALCESAGALIGPVEAGAAKAPTRTRSVQWRKRQLGINERKLGADACARCAVEQAAAVFSGLGALAGDEHVCEAAWLARDAWGQQ